MRLKKYLLIILCIAVFSPLYAFSASLENKYPSYIYVFSEFGVDESYIYDRSFERFVLKNEKKIQKFYQWSMKKGKDLLPLMKDHLMVDGLSDLFIYVSMIESGFSPTAVSSKKAVGLWQFMPATANHYRLTVCNGFDERCDPVSSTNAAVKYLRKLHKQFGAWYLAVIAYNCGEGRLKKAIKKAGSKELDILLDENEKYLPTETRNYIRKILLAAMIGENELLDYSEMKISSADTLMQVQVNAGTRLSDIAKMLEMKPSLLLQLNQQFGKGVVPKDKERYNIVIPEEKMIMFYMKYESSEKEKRAKPHLVSHYVSMGETLESIARSYKTDVDGIVTVNHLKDEFLELDRLLLIPVNEEIFENGLKY